MFWAVSLSFCSRQTIVRVCKTKETYIAVTKETGLHRYKMQNFKQESQRNDGYSLGLRVFSVENQNLERNHVFFLLGSKFSLTPARNFCWLKQWSGVVLKLYLCVHGSTLLLSVYISTELTAQFNNRCTCLLFQYWCNGYKPSTNGWVKHPSIVSKQ